MTTVSRPPVWPPRPCRPAPVVCWAAAGRTATMSATNARCFIRFSLRIAGWMSNLQRRPTAGEHRLHSLVPTCGRRPAAVVHRVARPCSMELPRTGGPMDLRIDAALEDAWVEFRDARRGDDV